MNNQTQSQAETCFNGEVIERFVARQTRQEAVLTRKGAALDIGCVACEGCRHSEVLGRVCTITLQPTVVTEPSGSQAALEGLYEVPGTRIIEPRPL